MKKKILVVLFVIVALLVLIIGYIVMSSRNLAKSEAKTALSNFAGATSSQWYCENGYGKGIDNQTPWWEEIYLSDAQAEETATKIEGHLRAKGYSTSNKYIENSQDSYNKGRSYWEIEGSRNAYSVQAKVSSRTLTLNNCFKGSSNMNNELNPENYNSVIVVHFKSGS